MSLSTSQSSARAGDADRALTSRYEREASAIADTFEDSLSISLDEPVGSLSMSPSNRDIVLGARKVGLAPLHR
jgi:hypothetical protein